MRESISAKNWQALDGAFVGVSLGYDFVAEHESGVPYFRKKLGIPEKRFPLGVEDRTVTQVPDNLRFYTYNYAFKKKSARKYQHMPAAMLLLTSDYNPNLYAEPATDHDVQQIAKVLGAEFVTEPYHTWYEPTRDDLCFYWSSDSGCILHVRGDENVAKLKEVYEAFLRKDISLNFGLKIGFLVSPVSFYIKSKLPSSVFDAAMESDLAYKHLEESAEKSGIVALLKNEGLKYYALTANWSDGPDSELIFWLNPEQQHKYEYGYYTLDELREWAKGTGPVITHKEIRDFVGNDLWRQYHSLCIKLLEMKIIARVYDCRFVWLSKEEKKIGATLKVIPGAASDICSGVYPVTELMDKYYEATET